MGKFTATSIAVVALSVTFCASAAGADDTGTPGQTIKRAGTQAAFFGAPANFDGKVRVEPLTEANAGVNAGIVSVTFAPGAHSVWHTHPKGQYLIVTAGNGRTQEWGKPVQELHVGDVVWCPPGVKHWHGATPDSGMTHFSIAGAAGDTSVTWLERVTDAQYNSR